MDMEGQKRVELLALLAVFRERCDSDRVVC